MTDRTSRRYAAVDVHYPAGGGARAALVVASDLRFATVLDERTVTLTHVEPYRPGAFFLRELPALRAVLAAARLGAGLDVVVVDGYVHLDPGAARGRGRRPCPRDGRSPPASGRSAPRRRPGPRHREPAP